MKLVKSIYTVEKYVQYVLNVKYEYFHVSLSKVRNSIHMSL